MKKQIWFKAALFMALILWLMVVLAGCSGGPVTAVSPNDAPDKAAETVVARIYYENPADLKQLANFDLFEYNNSDEQYVLAAVNPREMQTIQTIGFRVELDAVETAVFNQPVPRVLNQASGIPGYPCYRTVEETYAAAQDIVASYPNLAAWIDIGDSWEKAAPGGNPGYDLMVLRLTNSAITGEKPRLFIMTAVHAREYATAELNTRFAAMLAANYGVDPDITWLLDFHEIHLLLQANPDGRKQAETGLSWRKNTNENYCSPTSSSRGADLNRNFEFQWGCCSGSSPNQCDVTYRGPAAASEPETQAIQNYVRSIFSDQRGDALDDPAPVDAAGVFMDVHSYGRLVLWPWGWDSDAAPNGTALQTLGRKLAKFNNYTPKQAVELYPVDGDSVDFAYGELGVAAYVFEVGTTLFQSCGVFESTILPANLAALLYAAKASRYPYMQPAGPDVTELSLSTALVEAGAPVDLTAVLDDTLFSDLNGVEPTQPIAAAEYYIDAPDWDTANNPQAIPMTAQDGSFDSVSETAVAVIDTTNLNFGRHTIFVRGQDGAGNWGVVSAVFLDIMQPDFTIDAEPTDQSICAGGEAVFTINVGQISGYTEPVMLSSSGEPAGSAVSFAVNPLTPPGASSMTVSNTSGAAVGIYTLNVSGASTTGVKAFPLELELFTNTPEAPALTSPPNGSVNISTTPNLSWTAVSNATTYGVQIATDAGFANIVDSAAGLTTTSYSSGVVLDTSTVYYWRVWAENACGAGVYTAVYSFTTLPPPGECRAGYVPNLLLEEGFEAGSGGWTHGGIGDTWALSSASTHVGGYAYHAYDAAAVSDQLLLSPAVVLPANEASPTLKFWNYQHIESAGEACNDGGILEIATDGDAWTQLDNELLTDPYDGPILSGSANPLAGSRAWCGDPQDWLNSVVDLNAYAGQTVQFRFRLATNSSLDRAGWTLDDVVVQSCQPTCAPPPPVTDVAASLNPNGFDVDLGNWQKVIKNKGREKSANSLRKPQISNSSYFQEFSAVYLSWTDTGADEYEVHRQANSPYFNPDGGTQINVMTGSMYTVTGDLRDVQNNNFYVVVAKSHCGVTAPVSNRTGEFDFSLVPGST